MRVRDVQPTQLNLGAGLPGQFIQLVQAEAQVLPLIKHLERWRAPADSDGGAGVPAQTERKADVVGGNQRAFCNLNDGLLKETSLIEFNGPKPRLIVDETTVLVGLTQERDLQAF